MTTHAFTYTDVDGIEIIWHAKRVGACGSRGVYQVSFPADVVIVVAPEEIFPTLACGLDSAKSMIRSYFEGTLDERLEPKAARSKIMVAS